jgi:hypothetical protein
MATWTFEVIKEKLEKSNLWVARMIYRLSKDFDSIDLSTMDRGAAQTDRLFFDGLLKHFVENGHFTDRQIFLARKKIRAPYIEYLVTVSNS